MSRLLQSSSRLLLALLLGAGATLASLWLMAWLIEPDTNLKAGDRDRTLIEFVRLQEESELQRRTRREEIEPPEKQSPPPPPESAFEAPTTETPPPQSEQLSLDLDLTFRGEGALGDAAVAGAMGFAQRGLVPLSGTPPSYPRRARMMRIEGSVELIFTITTDGSVQDIEVLSSENGEHFEQAAIAALKRWRFRPRIVAGQPVEQRAIQNFDFKLDP